MRRDVTDERNAASRALQTLTVVILTLASAALILGAPVAGYVLLGAPGAAGGVVLSLVFMSRSVWRLMLAPLGASRIAGDVIGECKVCLPDESRPTSAAERRADMETLLRYGIDSRDR
jgi:hypothetical protein